MTHHYVLLHLVRVEQLSYSVNGNPRWQFSGIADDGRLLTFKTASNASSGIDCNMNCLNTDDRLKVKYHETSAGTLIADRWDDSRSAGFDLSKALAIFEIPPAIRAALRKAQANNSNDQS